jgi:hypothetical protein
MYKEQRYHGFPLVASMNLSRESETLMVCIYGIHTFFLVSHRILLTLAGFLSYVVRSSRLRVSST